VKTVRTAGTVTRALQLIEERAPEFALLDIGLLREKSFAVAERLEALGIPFAFISGYGTDAVLPIAFAQKPRLPKPCTADAMQAMLRSAVARRAAE
jgi:DNA-binding NtrC family response regulator